MSAAEIVALYQFEQVPTPSLTIEVKSVRVNMFVTIGKTYQVESSLDSSKWTPIGVPFAPTVSMVSQDFDVRQTGRFFRLKQIGQ